jgi:AAA domain
VGDIKMIKLRGVQPEKIEKRLKALFFGGAGVGKTTAAISFPKVYLIDTEKGAENSQYTKVLSKNGGVVFQTSDFNELMNEVKALLTEKHEYKTLVIDPLTTLYNDLLDKSAIKNGTDFGRHYADANKQIKHLLNLLLRLDMNVIITSHAKNEYGQNMSVLGQTFDCYKKLDYLFDLVFEIQKRGKDRVGLVKKSRIETFPDGEYLPFSYTEIAKRYGKDVLERDAVAQELADEAQVKELVRLIDLIKVPEEVSQKWLDKSGSEKWEEMPKEAIQKCIDHLESKIKGE